MQRPIVPILAGLALAGCASPTPPGLERAPRGPQPFISPAGEAFRPQPGAGAPLDAWWARVDSDRDTRLSQAEILADATRFFALCDRNGDRVIDDPEINAYEAATPEILPPVGGGWRGGRGFAAESGVQSGDAAPPVRGFRGGPSSDEGAARYSLLQQPQPLRAADTDQSGKITAAEFDTKARSDFARLDRNGDGQVVREELPPLPGDRYLGRRPRR